MTVRGGLWSVRVACAPVCDTFPSKGRRVSSQILLTVCPPHTLPASFPSSVARPPACLWTLWSAGRTICARGVCRRRPCPLTVSVCHMARMCLWLHWDVSCRVGSWWSIWGRCRLFSLFFSFLGYGRPFRGLRTCLELAPRRLHLPISSYTSSHPSPLPPPAMSLSGHIPLLLCTLSPLPSPHPMHICIHTPHPRHPPLSSPLMSPLPLSPPTLRHSSTIYAHALLAPPLPPSLPLSLPPPSSSALLSSPIYCCIIRSPTYP